MSAPGLPSRSMLAQRLTLTPRSGSQTPPRPGLHNGPPSCTHHCSDLDGKGTLSFPELVGLLPKHTLGEFQFRRAFERCFLLSKVVRYDLGTLADRDPGGVWQFALSLRLHVHIKFSAKPELDSFSPYFESKKILPPCPFSRSPSNAGESNHCDPHESSPRVAFAQLNEHLTAHTPRKTSIYLGLPKCQPTTPPPSRAPLKRRFKLFKMAGAAAVGLGAAAIPARISVAHDARRRSVDIPLGPRRALVRTRATSTGSKCPLPPAGPTRDTRSDRPSCDILTAAQRLTRADPTPSSPRRPEPRRGRQ